MGESITELETELSTGDGDEDEAKQRFLAMIDKLDVEESTQEHALAILKDEGLPAVKVRSYAAPGSLPLGCPQLLQQPLLFHILRRTPSLFLPPALSKIL